MMEFFDVINKRQSIRSYKSNRIEKEKLDKILEAARIAPTAKNLQAFKIFVIDAKNNKEKIKKIYTRDWFADAPLLILVCSNPGKNWVRNDGKNYSDVDAAIVMDHIILAATDLGLGTCWVGAFDKNAVIELLGLDAELEPIAFTPLGYTEISNIVVPRKSIDDLVEYIN
jgi:nitroreductase